MIVVTTEMVRCLRTARIAIDALIVDEKLPCSVICPLFCAFSHRTRVLTDPGEIVKNGWRFLRVEFHDENG